MYIYVPCISLLILGIDCNVVSTPYIYGEHFYLLQHIFSDISQGVYLGR